jgi:hypothetical protein
VSSCMSIVIHNMYTIIVQEPFLLPNAPKSSCLYLLSDTDACFKVEQLWWQDGRIERDMGQRRSKRCTGRGRWFYSKGWQSQNTSSFVGVLFQRCFNKQRVNFSLTPRKKNSRVQLITILFLSWILDANYCHLHKRNQPKD